MYPEEIEEGKQTVSDREGEGSSLSSSTKSLVYFIRFERIPNYTSDAEESTHRITTI